VVLFGTTCLGWQRNNFHLGINDAAALWSLRRLTYLPSRDRRPRRWTNALSDGDASSQLEIPGPVASDQIDEAVKCRIAKLIADHPVLLFMKGTVDSPMCGFSGRIIQVLKMCGGIGLKIHGVDVLEDETIRSAMKIYSNWPMFPQLYVMGEFVGGLDTAVEMFQDGSLQKMITRCNTTTTKNDITAKHLEQS